MNRMYIADAVWCLDHAVDYTAEHGDFWRDIRRRLECYYRAGSYAATDKANHPPIKFPKPICTYKSLDGHYANGLAHSINQGLVCANTFEGNDWHSVTNIITAHEPPVTALYRSFTAPGAKHITTEVEVYHTYSKGLIPAAILREVLGLNYKPGMYPHFDPEDPTMIRYIPPNKLCSTKNFVTSKPGKYLAAYYSDHLTTTEIAHIAAKVRSEMLPPTLQFATTANEISRVYARGPHSCMAAGKAVDKVEPVRAYASPDFAVAYIERNGSPTARTVVHPGLKIYVRIYGDVIVMAPLLKKAGYVSARDIHDRIDGAQLARLNGARLTALRAPNARPAYASHEAAGEPVLITPYFDLAKSGMKAWYDPDDGYLKLAYPDLPKGRIQHLLYGGYSIHGVPADQLPKPHSFSADLFYTQIGDAGNNGNGYLTYREAGRLDWKRAVAKPKTSATPTNPGWTFIDTTSVLT